jgi:hypothetical protein
MTYPSVSSLFFMRFEIAYTYCARDRLTDMEVDVGLVSPESDSVPGGLTNTISRTYATGGRENSFVIHFGAPCWTPMIRSDRMIPVSGSTSRERVSTVWTWVANGFGYFR